MLLSFSLKKKVESLQGVDQIVQLALEGALHDQSLVDGHVEDLAVADADALVGDALVEQLHSQVFPGKHVLQVSLQPARRNRQIVGLRQSRIGNQRIS